MTTPLRVLHLSHSEHDRQQVRRVLAAENDEFELVEANSMTAMDDDLHLGRYDFALCDIEYLEGQGASVWDAVTRAMHGIPVLLLTSLESEELAVEAVQHGAIGYVIRTVSAMRHLPRTLRNLQDQLQTKREYAHATGALRRISRARKVMARCNQTLVQAKSEPVLLEDMCRIVVDHGAYGMAWIGLRPSEEQDLIVPVAQAGLGVEFLAAPAVMGDQHVAAPTPASQALLLGEPFIARITPSATPQGAQSVVAIPLVSHGKTFGALTIFANELDAFDDDEVEMIRELADDIAYGILALRTREQLTKSESMFEQLATNIREVFFLRSVDAREMYYVSPGYEEIWGRSCESVYANPLSWVDALHPDDRERMLVEVRRDFSDCAHYEREFRIVRPDGEMRWLRSRTFPIRNAAGEIDRVAGVTEDISERVLAQEKAARVGRIRALQSGINASVVHLRDRQVLLDSICRIAVEQGKFGLAWVGLMESDLIHMQMAACYTELPALCRLIEQSATDLTNQADSQNVAYAVRQSSALGDTRPHVVSLRGDMAFYGHRALAAVPILRDNTCVGTLMLYAVEADFFGPEAMAQLTQLSADVSFALQYLEHKARLEFLAYYDALTALPNATMLRDKLRDYVHAAMHGKGLLALLILNIERFQQLNDTFGRAAGDILLQSVAARVQECVSSPSCVSRVGADTFAVAMLKPTLQEITRTQEQIAKQFQKPIRVKGRDVRLLVRIGKAIYPDHGESADVLFEHAQAALREARNQGLRNVTYSPEISTRLAARLALENALPVALEMRQFVLHYQPRVDLISGHIVGAEALVRWQHPERGLVPPSEFIPLSEETDLIMPLGKWVIDTVCAQQRAWLAQNLDVVPVAVNISAVQFRRSDLLQTLKEALTTSGLAASHLEIELTESAVMQDPAGAVGVLEAIRKMGIRLSLDDFGTGYSSLAHLKRFPFDFVKIDRAFVTDVTHSPDDAAIANAVIAMAHRMRLRVVAEGVETEQQLSYLRTQGCDEIQGYYFSKPLPADEFVALLRSGKSLTPQRAEESERAVLLVDDDPHIVSAIKRELRHEGYRVFTAGSGKEGLDLLAMHPMQVIISDQRMPGMTGAEFLGVAKELYPDTIRIILSGYTDLKVITESVNRGAVYKFLTKPWEEGVLREHIRDAFRRYRPTVQPDGGGALSGLVPAKPLPSW